MTMLFVINTTIKMKINEKALKHLKFQIENTKSTNKHYIDNQQMFDALVEEVFSHITSYGRRFKSNRMKNLREWIQKQLPFLNNACFSFDDYGANECSYLIFHGMTNFPRCSICGKILDDPKNFGSIFHGFMSCSLKCKELRRQQSYANTCIDRYGVPHYASNKERYEQRCDAMEKKYGVRNVFALDSTKETIRQTKKDKYGDEKYTNVQLMRKNRYEKYDGKWESDEAKQKRKQSFIDHYGVDHNMKSAEGLKAYEDSVERKYGNGIRNISQVESVKQKKIETCRKNYGVDYTFQSPVIQHISQETCKNLYGVQFPMQNHDIRKKARSKYFYDNQWFDSAPEIAFYIWLTDNCIEFEHEPVPGLQYEVDNSVHVYFPDFKVSDMYFEIKGDQFFDENGKLIDPYHKINEEVLHQKQQCMIDNNVVVLKSLEYKMFVLYVKQTYGCNYLKQFKVNKKQVNKECYEECNKRQ